MDCKFFDPKRPEDDFKIHIDANGQWFHDGTPIAREKLSTLFATALYYDAHNNEYWLITPHEQGRIKVEKTPFIIINYLFENNNLKLFSNLKHEIIPDKDNPIFISDSIPHILCGNKIPTRINRMVREKLIDIALSQNGYNEGNKTLYLKANGHDHPLASS
jgi:uncharacterized protein